MHRCLLARRRA